MTRWFNSQCNLFQINWIMLIIYIQFKELWNLNVWCFNWVLPTSHPSILPNCMPSGQFTPKYVFSLENVDCYS